MIKKFLLAFRVCIPLLLICTLLLGGIYPLVVGGFAQAFFPRKSHGSLEEKGGKVIGSAILGQEFSDPKYFWGRLSATTPAYNAASSAASNLSPANPKLLEAANVRLAALQKIDPENHALVPVELITASGSGLDPHITAAAAQYQIARVAKARDMKPEDVQALIDHFTDGHDMLFFGRPYVNVLELNLALDEAADTANQAATPEKSK